MSALVVVLMLFSFQPRESGIDAAMRRAADYAGKYLAQMGSVIGEERYLQEAGWEDVSRNGRTLRSHRERQMVSDFLTVPVGDTWVGFRHVREVDGVTLDPLYKGVIREAFDETTPEGREQLQERLTFESIRYNIGDFSRPANLPTFALELLTSENLKLFKFTNAGQGTVDGTRVMKVRFAERMPTSFVMSSGIGAPLRVAVSGSFSIESSSGRIFETELIFVDPEQPKEDMRVHVRFKNDRQLGLLVPIFMEEHFHDPFQRHEVDCTADYQNFRHFETAVQLRDPSGFLTDTGAAAPELRKRGDDSYALRVNVPLVNVEAWVTASSGSSVTDLAANDFLVLENKTEQTITNFGAVSTPYDVLLLFDHSGSTVTEWQMMQKATQEFVANLRPQDRVAIANFDTSLRTLTRWTDSRERIAETIAGLTQGRRPGGTAFYTSVERSLAAELLPVAGRRRAMVILSDGRDNGLFFNLLQGGVLLPPQQEPEFQQLIELIRRERIPLYMVAVNGSSPSDEITQLKTRYPTSVGNQYLEGVRTRLETMAEASGGRVLYADRFEAVIPLYKQISRELGSAYSIGYISNLPPSVTGFREITVTTRDNRLHVIQSRAGYRMDPPN